MAADQETKAPGAAAVADDEQPAAPSSIRASSEKPATPLQRFWRGTLLQCIITGMVSFAEPGIWNALNSLGAGGQQKPYLVNAANAITFGYVVFSVPATQKDKFEFWHVAAGVST